MIKLITRGDDAGSFQGANRALVEACQTGALRNISVMVPGPRFAEAAKLLAPLDVCLGLHVTLNAEWDAPKWRPVSPPETVTSLVSPEGFFLPTPAALTARGFEVVEVLREIAAQLAQARRASLEVRYIDDHMGVGSLPELLGPIADMAQREGLILACRYAMLPPDSDDQDRDVKTKLSARLQRVSSGVFTWVTHPSYSDAELQGLRGVGYAKGGVARERDDERRLLCDPGLPELLDRLSATPVRYDELPLG